METGRVLRYQRGNQKPKIGDGQITQYKKKKDKRTNNDLHTHKTKDRVTRTSRG
jgi:hypothetical protein